MQDGVFMGVKTEFMVFLVVAVCSVVFVYQHFRGPCFPVFMVEVCSECKVDLDIGRIRGG